MPQLDQRRRNPKPANVVGARVQLIRKERGTSQAELAVMMQAEVLKIYKGITYTLDQSDVSRIEGGHRPVWDYELKAAATALGVSSDYLLALVDDQGRIVGDDE